MKLSVAALVLLAVVCDAQAQVATFVVSRKGAKCLTAVGPSLVAAACSGAPEQRFSPNFAVGGLQFGSQCLRRSPSNLLTLAACTAGDASEVFEINDTTMAISSAVPSAGCVSLNGSDWRDRQPISLEPCAESPGQKWLLATEETTAPPGRKRQSNSFGELHSGDAIIVGERFLLIK